MRYLPRHRSTNARDAAEAAFKANQAGRNYSNSPAIPGAKEQVTLRIDQDILDFFQASRAGLAGSDC